MQSSFVIGVDFGTDSVRSVIINAANGAEIAQSVFYYPRWKQGLYCNIAKNQYRQHPLDYIEGIVFTVNECLGQVTPDIQNNIKAIGIDTTGSTPCAVSKDGIPLALLKEHEHNPNAMFVLWKDHTAIAEAEQINRVAETFDKNYLEYVGGVYSSEWFWAKALHISNIDASIKAAAYTWIEHSDWMPFLLTGKKMDALTRNICAAGHKGLWSEKFNGFPPVSFFEAIDSHLGQLALQFPGSFVTSDIPAGRLTEGWAQKLNLSTDVVVCSGILDAHAGAVGAEIEPYQLIKIIGTSTCDIMVGPEQDFVDRAIKGICGQVNGSVLSNYIGLEAGQSAFGDIFQWYVSLISWITKFSRNEDNSDFNAQSLQQDIFLALSYEASQQPPDENIPLTVDWFNGRRTPYANQSLKGAINGLTLGCNAGVLFRSLVEGACLGARKINDCFTSQDISIKGITAIGGIAKKSPFVMQTLADVLQLPIKVHKSENTCALGAAMNAAAAAGIYGNIHDAMRNMSQGFIKEYHPDISLKEYYDSRFKRYCKAGQQLEMLDPKIKEEILA